MILQVLIAMVAGWINRHQRQVIAYLLEKIVVVHTNNITHYGMRESRSCSYRILPWTGSRISLISLGTGCEF